MVLISSLIPFFERAEHFAALTRTPDSETTEAPSALTVARLAYQMGETELGRALLARTGGLLDSADAQAVLEQAVSPALLLAARNSPGTPPTLPNWSAGEREMFIRVLAGYLLSDDPRAEPQPGSMGRFATGLWVLPAQADQARWAQGLNCLNHSAAPGTDTAHVLPSTWISASWGSRWGIKRFLAERSHTLSAAEMQIDVEATEELIATLGAAYSRSLPRLIRLLSRPLLIDGLQSLPQPVLEMLGELLRDAVRVFGWTVIGLPGVERPWPATFEPWPGTANLPHPVACARAGADRAAATFHLQVWEEQPTLEWLAQTIGQLPGRTLVMLPSRGSAARLAGLVNRAQLLSTSLCPVHLDDRADALAAAPVDQPLCVIATTLPSTLLEPFDQVWHLVAPLPYLAEAAALCSGDFHVLSLVDVAVPLVWATRVQHTTALLREHPDALTNPDIQRGYYLASQTGQTDQRGAYLQGCRSALNYASLASELLPRTEHSVPVLIPYDDQAQLVIARLRRSHWLSSRDLRYAAWLTPGEAMRAMQRGDAEPSGWPLIWTASYDPLYGLAANVVAQTQLSL